MRTCEYDDDYKERNDDESGWWKWWKWDVNWKKEVAVRLGSSCMMGSLRRGDGTPAPSMWFIALTSLPTFFFAFFSSSLIWKVLRQKHTFESKVCALRNTCKPIYIRWFQSLSLTTLGLLLSLYAYIYEEFKLGYLLTHDSLKLLFLSRNLFCKFLWPFTVLLINTNMGVTLSFYWLGTAFGASSRFTPLSADFLDNLSLYFLYSDYGFLTH